MTGKIIKQIREAKLTKSEHPNACNQRPNKKGKNQNPKTSKSRKPVSISKLKQFATA